MDTPITDSEGNSFCLYDVIPDASSGGIDIVVMEDQFAQSLLSDEKKLYRMICSGFLMPQIVEELGIDEENRRFLNAVALLR